VGVLFPAAFLVRYFNATIFRPMASIPSPIPPSAPKKTTPLGRVFEAFTNQDFRRIWYFYVINALGMNMDMVAQGWLVLEITDDSAFWVGAVVGLRGVGQIGFGAVGGLLADRFDRRAVLAAVQAGRAIIFGALGLLVVTDQIQLWHVLPVAVISGMLMATMLPAGEALVYDAVGPKRLLNATAFKSGAWRLAGIVSSLAAGFVISAFGTGWCYLLVAALMVVSPLPLLWVKTRYSAPSARKSVWQTLSEGVSYASKSPPVRSLLIFSMALEMFGYSYYAMLPVIAKEVLHLEADGLGYLSAASNVGGVLSILLLAAMSDFKNRTLIVVVCGLFTGAFLILFAMSSWFVGSLVLVGLIGASLSAYDPTMSASLQTLTADAMRGRIMGLYGLTFGFTPVGGFVAGSMASAASAPFAVGAGGVMVLACVGLILLPTRSLWRTSQPAAPWPQGAPGAP